MALRVVAALRDALPDVGHPPGVLLIDGPSGAGKSSLADALARFWPQVQVVRLDDIYDGWMGLGFASSHIRRELLLPRRAGRPARWQRYNWATGTRAEWHPVDGSLPLIIEGCGAITAGNARLADATVWLDADDDLRRRRALARDRGGFDAHWDLWQRQFDAFLAREQPRRHADVILQVGE